MVNGNEIYPFFTVYYSLLKQEKGAEGKREGQYFCFPISHFDFHPNMLSLDRKIKDKTFFFLLQQLKGEGERK